MATQAVVKLTDQIKKLDDAVKEYAITDTFTQAGSLAETLKLAQGMNTMRELLTEQIVNEMLLPLRGSPLGFLTDRDSGKNSRGEPVPPYEWRVLRDCAIECWLRGFQVVGNEMNIIAHRFYATKNAVARKLRVFSGLTDLSRHPGVPVVKSDGDETSALVPYTIKYNLNGVEKELACDFVRDKNDPKLIIGDQRIPIKVNRNMGLDAIIGKASRKAMARLLDNLTGSTLTLPIADVGDDDAITTSGEPAPDAKPADGKTAQQADLDDLVAKHAPKNGAAPPAAEAAADEQAHASK